MLEGDIRVLRAQNLFDLARICHCPPPVVDVMRVIDFARFVAGLRTMRAQAQQGG